MKEEIIWILMAEIGFAVIQYFFLRFFIGCLGRKRLPRPINKYWVGGSMTQVAFTIMCLCNVFGPYSISFWAISIVIVCMFNLFGLYLVSDDSRKVLVQEEINGLEEEV